MFVKVSTKSAPKLSIFDENRTFEGIFSLGEENREILSPKDVILASLLSAYFGFFKNDLLSRY